MHRNKHETTSWLIAKIERARRMRARSLNLAGRQIPELPEEIGGLSDLEALDLSGNELTGLPESIGKLQNLENLRIRRNGLESLPDSIGRLEKLQSLDVSYNQLSALPDSIGKLRQLRTLDASTNELASLPTTIGDLQSLETLYLQQNLLTDLPEQLGHLGKLRTLDLNFNPKLSALPSSARLLSSLQILGLTGAGFGELPDSIREIPDLRELSVGGVSLERVPDWIGELTTLENLHVVGTRISQVPEGLGNLVNLTRLDLSENRLTSLPESTGNLRHLRQLSLRKNQIETLPSSLAAAMELLRLNLDGNPLSPSLASVYGQGMDELRAYLRSLDQAEPLYEVKLMLVGEGGVGKTTLLKSLSGRQPRVDEPTTHGVSIDIHSLRLPHPGLTGVEIQFNAWDFGGQEVYRVTHQFFFSPRSIYIVVWEPRMGVLQCQVEDWLKLIRLRVGDDAKVIIVSTHCKTGERIARIDRAVFLRDYGSMIVDFVEVDSLVIDQRTNDKHGIQELKEVIANTAARLGQMGMPFNVRWKIARDEALQRGTTQPHITYAEFSDICARHRLDATDTKTLAGLMHDLGYIVHYGADERLRNDVILQPEWLTKAIGFVLEDRTTQEREGILPDSHLPKVWKDHAFHGEPRYQPALYPFFLRLMERYDVSYRLEEGNASLVAQHVPQVRPDLPWLPEEAPAADRRRLAMLCVMEESPPGLIPWMIVRTHHFAVERQEHRLHWDKGMFLRNTRHGEAIVELRGRELHLYAEALWPEYFMNVLRQTLAKLIADNWPGLLGRYRFTVPCRQRSGEELCQGRFDIDALRQFLAEGDKNIRCQTCRSHQPILELLFGFVYDEPRDQLSRIESKLDQGFEALEQEIIGIESRLANAVMILMRAMANEAKEGPRLFDLVHTGRGWFDVTHRLRLWCEATNCEHPVVDEDKGTYTFKASREWLAEVTPYATFVAGVLRTLVPVVAPAVNLFLGSNVIADAGVNDHLDIMKTLSARLGGELETQGRSHGLVTGVLTDTERSGLLALHALIRELDPNQARLGLHRVATYTGDYQWLCRTHYQMSLPKIPDRIAH